MQMLGSSSDTQCITCRWFIGAISERQAKQSRFACFAYPEGIPIPIITGLVDHRTPYEGDNGIMWETSENIEEGGAE